MGSMGFLTTVVPDSGVAATIGASAPAANMWKDEGRGGKGHTDG